MSTTANRLAIMLASLILSSCVQGQDYQRPPVEVPDGWSRMTNTTAVSYTHLTLPTKRIV